MANITEYHVQNMYTNKKKKKNKHVRWKLNIFEPYSWVFQISQV